MVNRRSTIWVEYNGQRLCASDVARQAGVKVVPFIRLLHRLGDPVAAIEHLRSGKKLPRRPKAVVGRSTMRNRLNAERRRILYESGEQPDSWGFDLRSAWRDIADELLEQRRRREAFATRPLPTLSRRHLFTRRMIGGDKPVDSQFGDAALALPLRSRRFAGVEFDLTAA